MIINDQLEQQVVDILVVRAEELASVVDVITPDQNTESETVKMLRRQLESLEAIPGDNPAIEDAKSQLKNQLASTLTLNSNQSRQSSLAREEMLSMFGDRTFWNTLSLEDKKRALDRLIRQIVIDGKRVVRVELLF